VLRGLAGADNGPVPTLLYVPRLRASFPSTPVESRVGERHTEGSCWVAEFVAEENREYPLANESYYWSMNSLREEGWRSLGAIGTLYWALSGYGGRATRAFLVLIGICAAFAALYKVLGPPKLGDLGQALVYSLGAVARLNPELRPTEPGLFQSLVLVEGLLAPLQIALLALAVRRKVMR
jgi:hypothetical protein